MIAVYVIAGLAFLAPVLLSQSVGILKQCERALQLRNLQTLVEIAVDENSTVVFPAPLMSAIQEPGAFLELSRAPALAPAVQWPERTPPSTSEPRASRAAAGDRRSARLAPAAGRAAPALPGIGGEWPA